ncbi:hypothetical protein M1D96_13240 [Pseudomonas sp. D1-3]
MNDICSVAPTSDACRNAVSAATQYVAMREAWDLIKPDVTRSSEQTFDYIFNSPGASERFTTYYNSIDNRADFFGASDRYEQNVGSGAKWYGGAEFVSRARGTGLGVDGNLSYISFALGSLLANSKAGSAYGWRAEAGEALMNTGFSNFKDLYNNRQDAVAWDIKQLHSEQSLLQPIHEKYLKDKTVFTGLSKIITNSDYVISKPLDSKSTQSGGVDILDYESRMRYGCKLLNYGVSQGCVD